ncbi:pyridoxal phosphate-dependent aminotransferase family protein [soil metagenome]
MEPKHPSVDDNLKRLLEARKEDLTLRRLEQNGHLIDFASNDYLGLARSIELRDKTDEAYKNYMQIPSGATGSRLISGNHKLYEELETFIAAYHDAEAGLIFNSGYDANVGFFSAVPQPGDIVYADELVHASIRDGLKMTRAARSYFLHNDLSDLEDKLRQTAGNKFIAVESIYSMDGDFAPLVELVELAEKYGANLVVDEAHATGIFGPKGEGRVVELGLQNRVYARVHTFGKALGGHGAIVLGSPVLREFLVNYARSFIYTTALPLHSLLWVQNGYDILANVYHKNIEMRFLVNLLQQNLKGLSGGAISLNKGPIQSLIIPGNGLAKHVSKQLAEAGYYAKAILYPTVPRGKERIRICLHHFNTQEEVLGLCNTIKASLS